MSLNAVGTRGWAVESVGRGGQAAAAALIPCAPGARQLQLQPLCMNGSHAARSITYWMPAMMQGLAAQLVCRQELRHPRLVSLPQGCFT